MKHYRLLGVGLLVLVLLGAIAACGEKPMGAFVTIQQLYARGGFTTPILKVNQTSTGDIAQFQDNGTAKVTVADGGHTTFLDDVTIGNGTASVTQNGEDFYVEGTSEFDGAMRVDGAVDLNGAITGAEDLEHILFPSWYTTSFTYTAAAGGTVTLFTADASEKWLIHDVRVTVTEAFSVTGDDATMVIGRDEDTDGFCVLADAELQPADTEGTGWEAGWQCQVAATRGVFIDGTGGYVLLGAETIDAIIDESSGETYTSGAATVYIYATRLE